MEPTHATKPDDSSAAWHLYSARDGCVAVERHVRTVLVVVEHMLLDQTQPVSLSPRVEQLSA